MLALKWFAELPGVGRGPTVVGGSVMNVTYGRFTHRYHVIARDRFSGEELWDTDLPEGGYSWAPTDGEVLISPSGYVGLTAINVSDGSVRWSRDLGARIRCTVVIHKGQVVVPVSNRLVFLDLHTGEDANTLTFSGHFFFGEPLILGNTLFVQACTRKGSETANELIAIRLETGQELWRKVVGKSLLPTADSAGLATDGTRLFCCSAEGALHAFDAWTGKHIWQSEFRCPTIRVRPVFAVDTLYLTTLDGELAGLDPDSGERKMFIRLGDEGIQAPPLRYRDRLYVVSSGDLVELDLNGNQIGCVAVGHTPYTRLVAVDDLVYVTGGDPPDAGAMFGVELDSAPTVQLIARPESSERISVEVSAEDAVSVTVDGRAVGLGPAVPLTRAGENGFQAELPIYRREKAAGRLPIVARVLTNQGTRYGSVNADFGMPHDYPSRVILDIARTAQKTPTSSGAATIETLARYWGKEPPRDIGQMGAYLIERSGLDPHHKWRTGSIRILHSHNDTLSPATEDQSQLLGELYTLMDVPLEERHTTIER